MNWKRARQLRFGDRFSLTVAQFGELQLTAASDAAKSQTESKVALMATLGERTIEVELHEDSRIRVAA